MVTKLQIGMNVKLARVKVNMTATQLAEKTGMSITTISHIENGKVGARIQSLSKIADVLGTTVDALLKESE